MPRTDTEIDNEIQTLKAMKPFIPQHTYFGDDNWRKIDIIIDVLTDGLDEDDIDDTYDNVDEYSTAIHAYQWCDGDDDCSPVEDWRNLAASGGWKNEEEANAGKKS